MKDFVVVLDSFVFLINWFGKTHRTACWPYVAINGINLSTYKTCTQLSSYIFSIYLYTIIFSHKFIVLRYYYFNYFTDRKCGIDVKKVEVFIVLSQWNTRQSIASKRQRPRFFFDCLPEKEFWDENYRKGIRKQRLLWVLIVGCYYLEGWRVS